MPKRELPARPDLDHLKRQAKALRKAFLEGDAEAVARVRAVLGDTSDPKLTEAQRVIAREYGFRSWSQLRSHVEASRGVTEAVDAFMRAVSSGDRARAQAVLEAEPRIVDASVHVAAVLGDAAAVERHISRDPDVIRQRAGQPSAEPLLWLGHSPFHGENAERDDALATTVRVLLEAGADPNAKDDHYGVPALYAVTGVHNVPRIARMLLQAGANPTDGESVFHAAEKNHVEALELLLEYGVELNETGDWGNSPLHFLLNWWDLSTESRVEQGLSWLLDHGADPDVRSGRERETALHAAARRGQPERVVKVLIERGADVNARRADGKTAWLLARRGGFDGIAAMLEGAGAVTSELSPADELIAACGRGDSAAARRLTSAAVLASLDKEATRLITDAASRDRTSVVLACLAAGFPVDTRDATGATALHHAAIHGNAMLVRALLEHGADWRIRDREHSSSPLGWACFGADTFAEPDGDYVDTVRALIEAGARPARDEHWPQHAGVGELLRSIPT